jgi:ferric-dicitrate binding protein FerR (iron transport regulator)
MDISEQIINILIAFQKGEATPSEKEILDEWILASENNRKIFESVTDQDFISGQLKLFYSFDDKNAWNEILERSEKQKVNNSMKSSFHTWKKWAIAATFAGISLGGYFYNNYKNSRHSAVIQAADIKSPSVSRAFIKMQNGRIVILDSIKTDNSFKINGVEIGKNKAGAVVVGAGNGESITNTLYNPRGSKIVAIVLSDGTRVWLNSESFITDPVCFSKSERRVTMSGEAYFEVAKRKTRKFIVTTLSKINTEVLGTHFDIKDYPEDNTSNVVLLEGSVKVTNAQKRNILLRKSQQAIQNKKTDKFALETADLGRAVAWKKGLFDFRDDDIYSVTRQLRRWYDINVEIDGVFAGETYSGSISRDLSLMQVLQILKRAGVNYALKGKTLFINKT